MAEVVSLPPPGAVRNAMGSCRRAESAVCVEIRQGTPGKPHLPAQVYLGATTSSRVFPLLALKTSHPLIPGLSPRQAGLAGHLSLVPATPRASRERDCRDHEHHSHEPGCSWAGIRSSDRKKIQLPGFLWL